MKKVSNLIVFIVLMVGLIIPMNLSARGPRSISAYAGLGYSFSDYEGPVLDFGLELQFAKYVYTQVEVDYYLDPLPDNEEMFDLKYKLLGVSAYGVYKFLEADSRFNIFLRAGGHVATVKWKTHLNGATLNASTSDLGIGGGLGIQYAINEKFGLMLIGTVKHAFSDAIDSTWYKVSGTVTYRFR